MIVLLFVPDMFVAFWVRPCLVLSINFLVVISPFVNDLFLTLDPLEGLGYSLSFVLICCKVLVPFLLFLSPFCGFVGSLNPSRGMLSLAPAKGLCLHQRLVPVEAAGPLTWPILIKGIFVAFMASLVTYIHQSGILSLGHFLGDLHPFKESCHLGFVSDLHPSWQNFITLTFICLIPVGGIISNLHPSRRNLVT